MSDSKDNQAPVTATSQRVDPTTYPGSASIEDMLDRFWQAGPGLEDVQIVLEPPERSLALLEQLGPSPFERKGFPLIGFLATTYDRVSRYALDRG